MLKQHDEAIQEGHFPPAFGPDLLPGMYSMPVGVVPKPHSTALHLVTAPATMLSTVSSLVLTQPSNLTICNTLAQYYKWLLQNMAIHLHGYSNQTFLPCISISQCTHYGK